MKDDSDFLIMIILERNVQHCPVDQVRFLRTDWSGLYPQLPGTFWLVETIINFIDYYLISLLLHYTLLFYNSISLPPWVYKWFSTPLIWNCKLLFSSIVLLWPLQTHIVYYVITLTGIDMFVIMWTVIFTITYQCPLSFPLFSIMDHLMRM